jgi:hypothetical protein
MFAKVMFPIDEESKLDSTIEEKKVRVGVDHKEIMRASKNLANDIPDLLK